ncbi:MAG: LysR family transcriptional regulator [Rhodospirillales bacterium]|jgi:LysR family transcriptional regulator, transcriptional activator for bauABCD operon|nr:LysR family transcriptional regulator [Rhodospirillales bacterium]
MTSRALLGQLSDVDVRLLRVFRAVVESGGVSAAELELNIGRSAISRHLKDLETRLNVVLCRRGRGGFAMTDEGRHVYEAALRLLAALDTFRSEVNEVHRQMTGNLSVAMFDKTTTNPACKISDTIFQFDELAPEVTLDVYVAAINTIEKGVMDGQFNIGIIPSHRTSPSLNYLSLFDEHMSLYIGHKHPLFPIDDQLIDDKELQKHKYVGLGYHSPNMDVSNKNGNERHASCYDQEAVATLILSGRYLGYLPDHYAKSFQSQGLVRSVNADKFAYECNFTAISRRSPKPSRITQTFIECLEKAHSHNN